MDDDTRVMMDRLTAERAALALENRTLRNENDALRRRLADTMTQLESLRYEMERDTALAGHDHE